MFTEPLLSSDDLTNRLNSLAESPWGAFELNQNRLARRLRIWSVRPLPLRPSGTNQVRGYRLEDFQDVFSRYLPSVPPPSLPVTSSQAQVSQAVAISPVTSQVVTSTDGDVA